MRCQGVVRELAGVVRRCQYCVRNVLCFSKMSDGVSGVSGSGYVVGMSSDASED